MPAKARPQRASLYGGMAAPLGFCFRENNTLTSVNVASNNHFKTVTHHFVQSSESTPPCGARRRR